MEAEQRREYKRFKFDHGSDDEGEPGYCSGMPPADSSGLILAYGSTAEVEQRAALREPGMSELHSTLRQRAPAQLTATQVCNFIKAAQEFGVTAVFENVPLYLTPLLQQATTNEVLLSSAALQEHCGIGHNNSDRF